MDKSTENTEQGKEVKEIAQFEDNRDRDVQEAMKPETFSLIALNDAKWEDADKGQKKIYEDSLTSALELKTVYDIAISGPYGSGKSFVISTFFNQEKYKNETIYISLGTFRPRQKNEDGTDFATQTEEFKLKDESDRQEVEQAILQQLVYHVTPETTPSSRILRISKMSDEKRRKNVRIVSISLICLTVLLKPDFFNYPSYELFNISYFVAQLIALIILVYHAGRALIDLFGSIKNIRISKFGTDLAEVALDDKKNSSIFNRYLDEILHFFECTAYQYVIIEDLDRFNDVEIFTRLRSLNRTINNYPPIKGEDNLNKRRIRFIYAVKDDLFVKDSRDRTKFFDIIIPIIPVISFSNSEEKIKKLLIEKDLLKELNEDLIWQVSTFINDLRQVKNIINEYGIYRQLLKHIPNKNRLFALVVYKNLEPYDFSLFHLNQGHLFAVQKLRPILIEALNSKLEEDTTRIKKELKDAEKEVLPDIEDLKRVYISKGLELLKVISGSVQPRGANFKLEELTDLKKFDFFFIKNGIHVVDSNGVYKKLNVDVIDKRDGKPNNYHQRLKQIEDRADIHSLRDEIESNESDKRNQAGFSIQKQLKKVNYNGGSLATTLASFGWKEENKDIVQKFDGANQLLKFLVINGYLDDSVGSYATYFHSHGMSKNDLMFAQQVFTGGNGNKPTTVDNPAYLLRKLNVEYFDSEHILDNKLIAFLVKKKEQYPEKFDKVIRLITSDKKHLWFIDGYKGENSLEPLIIELANQSDTFFDNINNKPDDALASYIKTIIYQVNSERLTVLNGSGNLRQRISTITKLGSILDNNKLALFREVVELLNIRFENLTDLPTLERGIGKFIYEGNHYLLNLQMVEQIIAATDADAREFNLQQARIRNYSLINDLELSNLITYIETQPETYLTDIIFELPENTEEAEEHILFFVNHHKVEESTKFKLLTKQKAVISKLADVNNDFLPVVIDSSKFAINWGNLLHYFKIKGADDHLLQLLNSSEVINLDIFKATGLSTEEEWQQLDKFLVSILVEENLEKKSFERLTAILPNPSRAIDVIKGIDDVKRKAHILNKVSIPISAENIRSLEEAGSITLTLFLDKYKKEIKTSGLLKPSWEELISNSDVLNDKRRKALIHELFHVSNEDDDIGADINEGI